MPDLEFHEDLSREEEAVGASDRSFGFLAAAISLLIGVGKIWHGSAAAWWWLAAGVALAAVAGWRPRTLAPLNRLWLRLGLLMHKVVNPLVMALIFYGALFPTALVVRMTGKDLLRLKRRQEAPSYWIPREPAGAPAETMKHQF